MSFSFFDLTFHLYGFIIAIAIFIGIALIEKKAKKINIKEDEFWNLSFWILIGGIVGARVWHVITDFNLYQNNLLDIFKIWHGGLSILGAIVGGILAAQFKIKNSKFKIKSKYQISNIKKESYLDLKTVLDLSVFGLPFAQAIGRLGNYFNQELYGLPTNLPWGIYIKPEFRINNFKNFSYYHPLFAYEALAMLGLGIFVWLSSMQNVKFKIKNLKIGSGNYFLVYLIYYSIIRFLLDFLRIDKAMFMGTNLGVNQVVLLILFILVNLYLFIKVKKRN